jgi:hypothetical protein
MTGEGLVAFLAGVVNATAFHFDGDDVSGCFVMGAARLAIKVDPTNIWARQSHRCQELAFRAGFLTATACVMP